MNTYSNRRVANHLHGLIFELKERMNSRQDRPVMRLIFNQVFTKFYKKTKKLKVYKSLYNFLILLKKFTLQSSKDKTFHVFKSQTMFTY